MRKGLGAASFVDGNDKARSILFMMQ